MLCARCAKTCVRCPEIPSSKVEPGTRLPPDVAHYRFYEKVIKVKDDVAAIFRSRLYIARDKSLQRSGEPLDLQRNGIAFPRIGRNREVNPIYADTPRPRARKSGSGGSHKVAIWALLAEATALRESRELGPCMAADWKQLICPKQNWNHPVRRCSMAS